MNGLRQFLSNLKWLVINSITVIGRRRFYDPSRHSDRKVVYVHLSSNPYDRYLSLLVALFEIHQCYVVFNYSPFLLASSSTGLILQQNKNVFFTFRRPKTAALSLTNVVKKKDDYHFLIDHNYFSSKYSAWYLPMMMRDTFYTHSIYKQTGQLQRNEVRNLKIFFAGSFYKLHYNRPEMPDLFKMYTRYYLFQLVKHYFSSELVTPTDLTAVERDQSLVVIDTDKVVIAPQRFAELLSRSAFFLCFPGIVMPIGHNVVEAMAFGCIPILQYYNHFHPPLVDEENCLAFTNESALKRVIDSALIMPPAKIARMRENVIRYYQQYLSPDATIENVFAARNTKKLLMINAEQRSVDFLIHESRLPRRGHPIIFPEIFNSR